MKNIVHTRESDVILALPVPSGTLAGAPVLLGTGGLHGISETDRYVASAYTGFTAAPQGLKDGQAAVRLTGVATTATLTVDGAGAQFAPVYLTSGNVVTLTASSNTKIGYLLVATSGAGPAEVALCR